MAFTNPSDVAPAEQGLVTIGPSRDAAGLVRRPGCHPILRALAPPKAGVALTRPQAWLGPVLAWAAVSVGSGSLPTWPPDFELEGGSGSMSSAPARQA